MRACFLGQHVCALGFGIATLQLPPLPPPPEKPKAKKATVLKYKARKAREAARSLPETQQKLAS